VSIAPGTHATRAPGSAAPGGDAARPVVDLQRVCAAYGPYRALFDVSFSVPAGEVVALIGSNGAGKSTVARVLTGLLPSSSGTIQIDGQDTTKLAAWRIARLGVAHVPEGRGIFSRLTVEENLTLAFRQRAGRKKLADNLARAYQSFPILGERRKQLGGTLSGGQQRLLSLAKVLVVPPKLLVADELSLGLAPVVIDAVYSGLQDINKNGTALLVVEQQVNRVLEIAERAVVLDRGTVAFAGPADQAGSTIEKLIQRREEAGAVAVSAVDSSKSTGMAADLAMERTEEKK
jgi:branched-chain amino acid transport system ATP-binding protein